MAKQFDRIVTLTHQLNQVHARNTENTGQSERKKKPTGEELFDPRIMITQQKSSEFILNSSLNHQSVVEKTIKDIFSQEDTTRPVTQRTTGGQEVSQNQYVNICQKFLGDNHALSSSELIEDSLEAQPERYQSHQRRVSKSACGMAPNIINQEQKDKIDASINQMKRKSVQNINQYFIGDQQHETQRSSQQAKRVRIQESQQSQEQISLDNRFMLGVPRQFLDTDVQFYPGVNETCQEASIESSYHLMSDFAQRNQIHIGKKKVNLEAAPPICKNSSQKQLILQFEDEEKRSQQKQVRHNFAGKSSRDVKVLTDSKQGQTSMPNQIQKIYPYQSMRQKPSYTEGPGSKSNVQQMLQKICKDASSGSMTSLNTFSPHIGKDTSQNMGGGN